MEQAHGLMMSFLHRHGRHGPSLFKFHHFNTQYPGKLVPNDFIHGLQVKFHLLPRWQSVDIGGHKLRIHKKRKDTTKDVEAGTQ